EVDLVGLEEGLALGARGLDPLDVALVDAELGSDALGDLDIEAGVLAAFTKTETGLVELDADAQAVEALAVVTACRAALRAPRCLGAGVGGVTVTGTAGREHQGGARSHGEEPYVSLRHGG